MKEPELRKIFFSLGFFILAIILIGAVAYLSQTANAEYVDPYSSDTPIEDGYVTVAAQDDTFDRLLIYEGGGGDTLTRSYAEWNISSIPAGSEILDVDLIVDINSHTGGTYGFNIRQISTQPSISSLAVIYADAADGVVYTDYNSSTGEQITIDLGSVAVDHFTVNQTNDWWAVGFEMAGGTAGEEWQIWSDNNATANPKPTLQVTYIPPGGESYFLIGLFYENGTSAGSTTVTIGSEDGTTETVTVDGNTTVTFDSEVDLFSWPVTTDARVIAIINPNGTHYLFTPESTYGIYQFDINDYSGRIGQGTNYLEAYRSINGTKHLVVRREFRGITNPVPMILTAYEIYQIQIVFSDGSVWEHGYFYPGIDLTPTLAITSIEFSAQAHVVYTYIIAEATRPNATHIQLTYTDTTPGYLTTLINMTVTYRNGTHVYNTSTAAAVATMNWYGANNVTDYVVKCDATQPLHGSIQQTWVLDFSRTFEPFPDISTLGFGTINFIPIVIALIVAATCSFKSAALAPFMFMTTISIFSYVGTTNYNAVQLGIGWSLAIIVGLSIGERS